ncbi:unnamed protein product [Prunus armeniaca]
MTTFEIRSGLAYLSLQESMSWTDDNPGTRFWGCIDYEIIRGCSFFEWYDPRVCERSKIVICGLFKRLKKQEEENSKWRLELP